MDKYFMRAIKNIETYIDKCGIELFINECKYDTNWSYRHKEPWYTFKLVDKTIQEIEYEVSLPATEDFHDETIIYLDGSKWYVKNALITKKTILWSIEGKIEKLADDKEYYETLLNKCKDRS